MIAADVVDVAGSSMVESTPSFRNAPSSLSYSSRNFLHHKNSRFYHVVWTILFKSLRPSSLKPTRNRKTEPYETQILVPTSFAF